MALVDPPRWTDEELEHERRIAISLFREERLTEPVERYIEAFDDYVVGIERLMQESDDLRSLRAVAQAVLTDGDLLEAVRYLAGPPVSADDLMELVLCPQTFARSHMCRNP